MNNKLDSQIQADKHLKAGFDVANDYSGTGAAGSNSFRLTADGGTVSGVTSVAGNPDIVLVAGANITLTGTSPNQIKISSSGGGSGGMTSWTLRGNSGAAQTILDGNNVTIAGGGGLTSVASATDTVTVETTGVLEDLNTLGAPSANGEFIVATGSGAFAYESGADARLSLGLGTMATQNANLVAITGGSITGITDLAITDGGTGASTAQAAIDALTAVSGATTGHVLTKDGSGNATFQAATGGISGTIAVNQVTVGTGPDTIGGSNSLLFVETSGLTVTTGSTGNDPQIALSSSTKSIILEVATNQKLTVKGSNTFVFDASSATGGITWPDATTQITASPFASLTTSGTSGAATLLSGVLNIPNYTTGDIVSILPTAADILSVSSGAISGNDAGSDKIVFWDEDEDKLTYLAVGTGLAITGTTLDATGSGGEVNTASNVGTGTGDVFKQKTGVDLELKTIKAGTGISVTNNTSDITIAATGGGGLLPGGAAGDIQVNDGAGGFGASAKFNYNTNVTLADGDLVVQDTSGTFASGNVTANGVRNVLAGTRAEGTGLPDGSELMAPDYFGQTTILTGESYTLSEGTVDPTTVTGATATFIGVNDKTITPIISVGLGAGGGGAAVITDIIGGGTIGTGFTVAINEPFTVYILGDVISQLADPGLWTGPGAGTCVAQIFGNVTVV